MAHFKSKKTRRQIRCSMCTKFRWAGNAAIYGSPKHQRTSKSERNKINPTDLE